MAGFCECRRETSGSKKMREISQLARKLLDFQEEFSSIELVGWLVGWLVG